MNCTYNVTQRCVCAYIAAMQTQLRSLCVLFSRISHCQQYKYIECSVAMKIQQRILFALVSNYKYFVLLATI